MLKAIPALLNSKTSLLYSVVEPGYGLIIFVARIRRLRIVLHHHSAFYTKDFNRRFYWLSRLAGKESLHVALDEFMARDMRARYPFVVNVLVSHNASHVIQPILEERHDRPLTCGFMNNLCREKGLELVIGSLRTARSTGLDLQAILAGPPTSYEAEKAIEKAKDEFGDALTVLGPVSGARKQEFFRSIDVFLFPTSYTKVSRWLYSKR
jgi:glycosyltransferase involved in cell wall biosynthesis